MSEVQALYKAKAKTKPKHPESDLQQTCVRWFRYQYPGLLLYANMNHGKRGLNAGRLEKLGGFTAGIPDLFLASPRGGYGGMYIELKIHPNKPTPEQAEMIERLYQAGYSVTVCYNFDVFQAMVAKGRRNS